MGRASETFRKINCFNSRNNPGSEILQPANQGESLPPSVNGGVPRAEGVPSAPPGIQQQATQPRIVPGSGDLPTSGPSLIPTSDAENDMPEVNRVTSAPPSLHHHSQKAERYVKIPRPTRVAIQTEHGLNLKQLYLWSCPRGGNKITRSRLSRRRKSHSQRPICKITPQDHRLGGVA